MAVRPEKKAGTAAAMNADEEAHRKTSFRIYRALNHARQVPNEREGQGELTKVEIKGSNRTERAGHSIRRAEETCTRWRADISDKK